VSFTSGKKWPAAGTANPFFERSRSMALARGTRAHESAEYLLKTAMKLARRAGNRRNLWRRCPDTGLWRLPSNLTAWALAKARAGVPPIPFYARVHSRVFLDWAVENITAIYASEFRVCRWEADLRRGFAGTGDALVEIRHQGPFVLDWKTSKAALTPEVEVDYNCQLGGYALALEYSIGLLPSGATIVVARPDGTFTEHQTLNIHDACTSFSNRFTRYCLERKPG
jgi:hypothetical protein